MDHPELELPQAAPRSGWVKPLLAALGVGISLAILCGAILWAASTQLRPTTTVDPVAHRQQQLQTVQAQMVAAFSQPPMNVRERRLVPVRRLIANYASAMDSVDLADCIDFTQMAKAMAAAGYQEIGSYQSIGNELQETWIDSLMERDINRSDEIRIHAFLPSEDNQQAVVIFLSRDALGIPLKHYWRLAARGRQWRVFDMEITSGSVSQLDFILSYQDPDACPYGALAGQTIQEMERAVETSAHDIARAVGQFDAISPSSLPPHLRARFYMLHGQALQAVERNAEALEAYQQAIDIDPHHAASCRGIAQLQTELGQHEASLANWRKCLQREGTSDEIELAMADCYQKLGQPALELAAYRRALDFYPDSTSALLKLANLLPAGQRTEVVARFAKTRRPENIFQLLMNAVPDPAFHEQLSASYAQRDPSAAPILFGQALREARQQKFAEAAALYRTALDQIARPIDRRQGVAGFCQCMLAAGKPIEAYTQAPDPRTAFELLAINLQSTADLQSLVDAHAQADATDPQLVAVRARLLMLQNRPADAMPLLLSQLSQWQTEEDYQALWSYLDASLATGRAIEAYQQSPEADYAFNRLAEELVARKDPVALQTLIGLHRAKSSEPSRLLVRQAECFEIREQYEAALELLRPKLRHENEYGNTMIMVTEDSDQSLSLVAAAYGRISCRTDNPLQHYFSVVESEQVFESMAEELLKTERFGELEQLLEVHKQNHPGDLTIVEISARLAVARKDFAAADAFYATLVERADAEIWQQYQWRAARVRARCEAGQAPTAFLDLEPITDTLDTVAHYHLDKQEWDKLAACLAQFREVAPDDVNLHWHEATLKFQQHDHAGCLAVLEQHQQELAATFDWWYGNMRVDCLIKLDQLEAALAFANQEWLAGGNSQHVGKVLAVKGQPEAAMAVWRYSLFADDDYYEGFDVESLYDDAVLKPIVATEPYAAFRAAYPMPEAEAATGND